MSNMEIDRVLAQIRSMSQATKPGGVGGIGGAGGAGANGVAGIDNGFAKLLKQGIESVNSHADQGGGYRQQVRARRAGRRTAAGHARNAEGQRLVPRAHRSA
jgi:hypothetical protein